MLPFLAVLRKCELWWFSNGFSFNGTFFSVNVFFSHGSFSFLVQGVRNLLEEACYLSGCEETIVLTFQKQLEISKNDIFRLSSWKCTQPFKETELANYWNWILKFFLKQNAFLVILVCLGNKINRFIFNRSSTCYSWCLHSQFR